MIFVVIVQAAFMFYYCCQKDFFDGDEMFSYSLSNGNYTPFLRWNSDWWNQWHDTDYLTAQITVSEKEAYNYGSVIYNQTQDVHPPVYYCILHTICSLDQGHFSKWQGICVNLCFYILTLLLLYRSACLVIKDEVSAIIPMLCYGVSAGAVTTVLYIRMYMLMTFLCVLDVYLHILLLRKNGKRKGILTAIFLTTVAGGLTQYYFLVFAFISSMIYCIMKVSEIRMCIYYGVTRMGAVVVSVLIFPSAVIQTTTGSRGMVHISGILGNLTDLSKWTERFCYYMSYIDKQLFSGIGLQIGIAAMTILLTVLLLVDRRKIILKKSILGGGNKSVLYLSFLSLLYLFFVINYAPKVGKGFRYIVNIYPLISLCVCCLLINSIGKITKYRNNMLAVFSLCAVCVSIFSNKAENIEYLHSSNIEVIDQLQKCNISANYFINKSDSQEYAFWMQYQNMIEKENQQFLVTTYDRILDMDDQDLNQTIHEKYDDGILMYIATNYSLREAEQMVDSIIERTQLAEKSYIGTVDSERIFFCKD